MSVDIDWQTLTDGPDGEALARVIRDFVHERFQHINLPRLIRSVTAHSFEFGTVVPTIVLKDICDPLPDFYEDDEDDAASSPKPENDAPAETSKKTSAQSTRKPSLAVEPTMSDRINDAFTNSAASPTLSRAGVFGSGSNIGYFHLPLSAGLQGGRATPLAAVAGAHLHAGVTQPRPSQHHRTESFNSITPPSSATPPSSRPVSRDASNAVDDDTGTETPSANHPRESSSPEDFQVVFHATYSGDVKLSLTAEVFLDYPMPSFVGIPLKLNITGLTFNGVGIVAYIKKKAHLCFLSPEDAEALVGATSGLEEDAEDEGDGDGEGDGGEQKGPLTSQVEQQQQQQQPVGALIEDIKIETEMGETEDGKQVLKNVGKIEKFVLEQVRRIFEDEFVYPSFWTFLV